MTGPAVDPLASYTPDWRQKLQTEPDPLAGYSPNWREQIAGPPSPGGLPGLEHNPIESFGEFATGFAGGIGQGMVSIPQGAASVLFGPQSAEEQQNPIAQGYAAAKVGAVPTEPAAGLLAPGNIDLHKRPVVKNPDGSISTVRSFSFEEDGKEILVPTVSEDGRNLTEQQAVDLYHQTGKHLGIFDSPDAATRYAQQLHEQQAQEYGPGPFQQALAQAKGLATFPVTAVKDILQPPGTMEQQGERAANVYMAAEGARHLGRKGVEAYREGKAKAARIEAAAGDPLAAYTSDWREKIGEGLAPPREEMAEGGQAVSAPPAPPPRLENAPPIPTVRESGPETLALPEQGAALPPSRQLTAGSPEPTVTPPVSRETPPGPIEATLTGKKVKPRPKLGEALAGPVGAETEVQLHESAPLRARYRVVEGNRLRTSHDPFNFAPTAGYPEGVQGRDYLRNKALQETVRARSLGFDPEIALNPSRSATEGQPVMLPDGTVLAGNERAMLPQLAARRAPGRYEAYRTALAERAAQFGLDPAQVAAMKEPVLVRELTSATDLIGGATRWAEINRLSDITATKSKSGIEEGAARAQALNQAHDALRHYAATIGPDETVAAYLGGAHGRTFVKHLLDAGVLTKEELGRFTMGEGTLTLEGRETVRQMLMGSAVREPAVLMDAPPALVGKLEHAVPNIVALRGTAYDPSPLLTEALRLVGEMRAKGMTFRDMMGQGDLLGGEHASVQPLVREFAGFLEGKSKLAVSEAFRKFGAIARETIAQESGAKPEDMFGGTGYDPPRAFREAFGLEAPFQAAMGGGRKFKGSDPGEMSLFGDQEHGGMFSPTGAAGPVGSRPAGTEPPRADPALDPERLKRMGLGVAKGRINEARGRIINRGDDEAGYVARFGEEGRKWFADDVAALQDAQAHLARIEGPQLPGKMTAEEVARRPEAVQSEELRGTTEHAPGQQDIFEQGMGGGKRRIEGAYEELRPPEAIARVGEERNRWLSEQRARLDAEGADYEVVRGQYGFQTHIRVRRPGTFEQGMGGGRKSVTPQVSNPRPAAPTYPEPSGSLGSRPLFRPGAIIEAIQRLFNPRSLSEGAYAVGGTIRAESARGFRELAKARHAMRAIKEHVDKLPRADQVALWDAAERWGDKGSRETAARLHPGFPQMIEEFHKLTGVYTKQLLDLGILHQTIEHYVGRFWEKRGQGMGDVLRRLFGKRPLEGPKSFAKERTIERFTEGLDAGLTPATYNFVEAQLLKFGEMQRVIDARRMLARELEMDRAKRVHTSTGEKVPEDATGRWERLGDGTDPAFTLYGPKSVRVAEAFDANVREGLQKVIASLPKLEHLRSPRIGGERWGYAESSGNKMATKFGGENFVLTHELGHILDFRYGLWDRLVRPAPLESHTFTRGKRAGETVQRAAKQPKGEVAARVQIKKELRALADMRGADAAQPEGHATPYFRDKYEQIANALHARIHAPELMKEKAPTVYANLTRFLQENEKLRPLLDIKPGLSLGTGTADVELPGFPVLGHYYAPRDVAAVWNNYLSRGLAGNPLFDALRAPGQMATQLLLGFSGFHGTVISTEAAFSEMGRAAETIGNARPGSGKAALLALPRTLASPVAGATFGRRLMQEYLGPGAHPELGQVLDAMIEGGYRGTATSEMLSGERVANFKRAMREALHGESKGVQALGAAKVLPDAVYAAVEAAAMPILGKYVPWQKGAATYWKVADELKRLPKEATVEDIRRVMSDVVDEMDYRFGQVIYENHFLNNAAKGIAQLLFLAPGWTFGTLALAERGVADVGRIGAALARRQRPVLGTSAAYWVSAIAGTAFLNAVLTYGLTGQQPQGKDFLAFRDGTKDPDGNENRHTIPGYLMRDMYSWTHKPGPTLGHKLSPALSWAYSLFTNRNYRDDAVYNKLDPWPTILKQIAKSAADQVTPIAIQNFREAKRRQQAGGQATAFNAFGIAPAPRELEATPAQNRMQDLLAQRGGGGATPEQADKQQRRKDLGGAFRRGDIGVEELADSMHAGAISNQQRKNIMRAKSEPPYVARFKQLSWLDAEQQVYAKGNPAERKAWWPLLMRKRRLALKQLRQAGIDDERTAALQAAIQRDHDPATPGEPITVGGGE